MQTIGVIYTGKNNLLVCHCHLIDTGFWVVNIRLPEKYTGCLDAKIFFWGVGKQNTSIHISSFTFLNWESRMGNHVPILYTKCIIIIWVILSDGFSHNCLMMSSTTIALSYVIVLLTGKENAYWTHLKWKHVQLYQLEGCKLLLEWLGPGIRTVSFGKNDQCYQTKLWGVSYVLVPLLRLCYLVVRNSKAHAP